MYRVSIATEDGIHEHCRARCFGWCVVDADEEERVGGVPVARRAGFVQDGCVVVGGNGPRAEAPRLSSSRTIGSSPWPTAAWRTLQPSLPLADTRAPCWTSVRTSWTAAFGPRWMETAWCSTVHPSWSALEAGTPAVRSRSTSDSPRTKVLSTAL